MDDILNLFLVPEGETSSSPTCCPFEDEDFMRYAESMISGTPEIVGSVSPEALVDQLRQTVSQFRHPELGFSAAQRLHTLSDPAVTTRARARPRLAPIRLFPGSEESGWSPGETPEWSTRTITPGTPYSPTDSPVTFCATPIPHSHNSVFVYPACNSRVAIGSSSSEFSTPCGTPVKTKVTRRGPNIVYRREHVDALSEVLKVTAYPDKEQREELVLQTGLPHKLIQGWFKNARRRERRLMGRGAGAEGESPSPPAASDTDADDSVFFNNISPGEMRTPSPTQEDGPT